MNIKEIKEKSGLKMEVAESLYWKCLWLRDVKPDVNVLWVRLLNDINYRCTKNYFYKKH